jgi:hypothetical protein
MTTATAERQELYRVIDELPDDQLVAALGLLRGLEDNDDGFYDPANIQWLKDSIAQMAQGKTITKTFEELEQMANE